MEQDMTRGRRVFLWTATGAMGLFVCAQLWMAIAERGPEARARALMPTVGAQWLDEPLPEALAQMPLERVPGGTDQGPIFLGSVPGDTLVFLNLWATWCEPCVRELPSMLKLGRELRSRHFLMLAVSYDEQWATVTAFFRRVLGGMPRELTLARDPHADSEEKTLRVALGTRKLPETYVIRNGRILARFVNERDWVEPAMVEYFKRLLEAR
jgi:thiol-disulfide isomerase/thioredoxin